MADTYAHNETSSSAADSGSSGSETTPVPRYIPASVSFDQEEFLFRDADFEDDSFEAATFVAKYRRVSSLESLRDQLVNYSKCVKTQLYTIINRDYKDFITISTKLDGLDTRLEMMEKPMFDLQMDLSSLHTGIASSLHTIKDKIDEQQMISRKKTAIKAVVECMDQVAVAQSALQTESFAASAQGEARVTTNRRYRLYRQSQQLQKYAPGQSTSSSSPAGTTTPSVSLSLFEQDLFVCSEYERAASALCSARQRLQEMLAPGEQFLAAFADLGLPATVQSLSVQVSASLESLKSKIRAHLDNYFAKASTTAADTLAPSESLTVELRCFAHCLRALILVDHAHVAEQCLATAVIEPYLKLHFTQGKVDGTHGRNSFAGLSDCLNSLIEWIRGTQLVYFLRAAEEVNQCSPGAEDSKAPVDLVLQGVWIPVTQVLHTRFPAVFTVGIASVFSACYRAVDAFLHALPSLVSLSLSDDASPSPLVATALLGCSVVRGTDPLASALRDRLRSSESVRSVLSQFKADIYASLRQREAMHRVDRLCELDLRATQPSLVQSLSVSAASVAPGRSIAESVYGYTGVSSTENNSGAAPSVKVSRREVDAVFSLSRGAAYHSEAFLCTSSEALLCLRDEVALPPVRLKMMLFAQRVLVRLMMHIALVAGLYGTASGTPSAGLGVSVSGILCGTGCTRAEFEQMRSLYLLSLLGEKETEVGSSSGSPAPGSPVKGAAPAVSAVVPATPDAKASGILTGATPMKGGGPSASQSTLTVDQLVLLVADMLALRRFVAETFLEQCRNALGQSLSEKALTRSVREGILPAMETMTTVLWAAVTQSVVAECKKPLTSIKGIAGKYRMTNKPAPSQASPYVESVLAPLRTLCQGSLEPIIAAITESFGSDTTRWCTEVAELVAAAMQDQVTSLLDTVKSMDSALQRRAKIRTTTGGDGVLTDSDKIAMQLRLDIQAFGEEMKTLKITPSAIASFVSLQSNDLSM